jgi:23S rRNA (cytosine1962-C5)-methyltransferase
MNQDASFYIDTRNLRAWLKGNSTGKSILNTFAYTGSLGIAALAGGVERVVQLDRSRRFLDLARKSAALNHLDLGKMKCVVQDYFTGVSTLKREGVLFDTVILDPPFFSVTDKGRVDLATESNRLINKARPLVRDGGTLVVVNNALFLSGEAFMDSLRALATDGYLSIGEMIPIPQDAAGYVEDTTGVYPADPAPFNHPTKIVVLHVRRKDKA